MEKRNWLAFICHDHIVKFVSCKQKSKDGANMESYGNKAEVRSSNEHPNTMQARCDSYYDKWWIPAPKVPPNDLSYWLRLQKDSVNQVHKAVIAINSQVLSEMEIPESYIESLPWYNGRASRGDSIYKSTTKEHFDPDYFFTTMDMSSEHKFLESSRTRSKLRLLFGEEK
ncbi:hypothetical protein P3L10_023605 [Capsicum annuum]